MAAAPESRTKTQDSLESLERLKQVEIDANGRLQAAREKIDRALSQLRDDSEAQVQAAREGAEKTATAMIDRAGAEADTEAARIVAEAQAALAQRATEVTSDLAPVWDGILRALFDEFS